MDNKTPRFIDQGDWNLAYLFPDEVAEARQRIGLVILPVAPIEWHGPHMVMGCDPLLAHAFARRVAARFACPYYPPVFLGTERHRTPKVLESLGFDPGDFIEGMDFPANPVASAYVREETFALVIRDLLNILLNRLRFRHVLIVNGHGADNQRETLDRLCREFNAAGAPGTVSATGTVHPAGQRVMWVYPGFSHPAVAGSIGHANAEEASMLEAAWPGSVDIGKLPASGSLKYSDYAIVDGYAFDGQPTPDHTLPPAQDPRWNTNPILGAQVLEQAVEEVIEQVKHLLLD